MGTTYSIKIITSKENKFIKLLKKKIDDFLVDYNKIFSTYDKNSEISFINEKAYREKGVAISFKMQEALVSAFGLSEFTKGKFDPTVSPLVALWGFYNKEGNVPNRQEIAEAKKAVGYQKVKLDDATVYLEENMKIDLSAIAKGKAVDLVKEILDKEGLENYLIEIGGEIRAKGRNKNNQKWQIYIISPDASSSLGSLIASLDNVAIATSGDYQNYFRENGKKYSHIIDPTTGAPVEHNLASVSVVSENCETADALATALLVMGKKEGSDFAEKNNLATYFIYQEENSFVGLASPAFKKYMVREK